MQALGVLNVMPEHVERVRPFLERHADTSLFLLSNLRAYGPRAGANLYSGDFTALLEGDAVAAVVCLTRSGNLVVEAAGRTELADPIESALPSPAGAVTGVLGEWHVAQAVWGVLATRRGLTANHVSREPLYGIGLDGQLAPPSPDRAVTRLSPADFPQWEPLMLGFIAEQELPLQGSSSEREASFGRSAALGHWWGGWEDGALVAMASFNALYARTAQVGGVYTIPSRRRRGWSRAVMQALMHDAFAVHGVRRLILFTGEEDHAPRALYESMGFVQTGHFGLFFGK